MLSTTSFKFSFEVKNNKLYFILTFQVATKTDLHMNNLKFTLGNGFMFTFTSAQHMACMIGVSANRRSALIRSIGRFSS